MNKLFVISGPSGAGKGTVISRLMDTNPDLYYSVSVTTRKPRTGEINGINYNFISKKEFIKKIQDGKMLEFTEYCDNLYGTPLDTLEDNIKKGKSCILEIDVVGAFNVKEKCSDAVLIFVVPPSIEDLKKRLINRNTEALEIIEKRINKAKIEIEQSNKFDYTVVNNIIDNAVNEIKNIIKKEESSD